MVLDVPMRPGARWLSFVTVAAVAGCVPAAAPSSTVAPSPLTAPAPMAPPAPPGATPLVIGETFGLDSTILAERRVINVYLPPGYRQGQDRYPVLYMPDGGIDEDFLHITGFVDVSIKNQVIRPMLVVGIQNTERRRDLVGPTTVEAHRKLAPHAGGADRFRRFLRDELKPYLAAHYRVTAESAIIGESLGGLFVIETLVLDPTLFDRYIAADPSLWWSEQALVRGAAARFATWSAGSRTLFFTTSEEPDTQAGANLLIEAMRTTAPPGLVWHYLPLPDEHHVTIFPITAIRGLRTLFPAGSGR
jgi:predicted alpha/beta superfamily hydrolase